jgi:hypothetical protein
MKPNAPKDRKADKAKRASTRERRRRARKKRVKHEPPTLHRCPHGRGYGIYCIPCQKIRREVLAYLPSYDQYGKD